MKPPPEKQPPGSSAKEWLVHAQSDLQLARLASGRKDILPEQVCFHTQQAAEKGIKAVLLFKQIDFPLIHDIEELLELARQGGLALPDDVNNASLLTPYAVEARYPGQMEEISTSEVGQALHVAEAVVQWAAQIVG